jgi:class 3 adenylate cyclase
MTEEEARRLARDYLEASRDRIPLREPHGWNEPIGVYGDVLPSAWLLIYRGDLNAADPNSDFHALVIPRNGSPPHILLGALGKIFRLHRGQLEAPRSNERWLGSGPGRYQLFDGGIAMWYETPPNLAIPRYVPRSFRGRPCEGYVAFVDLRGFTAWTSGRDVEEIQELIAGLEDIFQLVFMGPEFASLFVKGIGDGLMIVSEVQTPASPRNFGCDALSFLTASATFVGAAAARLPRPLGIGAAVSFGPLIQVFLLGQYDYLGETLNQASKLQQLAWNDVVVSTEFTERLSLERPSAVNLLDGGKRLGDQGVRFDPERLIRNARTAGEEA